MYGSDRFEIEYKYLLLPDAADYHLPKPSDKAIPMPKSRKAKDALVTTKRHADDLPRKDDVFVEGATWAEFNAFNTPKNPAQAKADFTKERQIMHYLGKTSTEARAQYTADWTKPVYDIRCNFLETIPKPAPQPRASYPASYPRPNGQALNPSRQAPSRPILPPNHSQISQSSIRPDKPYVYKPKVEAYYKDAQVNRSQQANPPQAAPQKLQQAQPYAYGTDPRWRPADNRSQNPYAAQTQQGIPAAMAYYSGYSANPLQPANPYTSHISQPPSQPKQAKRSVGHGASQKPSTKSHNPRSSNGSAFKFNDAFEKYPYIRKEHNKAPGTYRSPYRQDGLGFCNGYEGDFKAHMAAQMLKNPSILFQRSMQASIRPVTQQANASEAQRKTYAPILPPPRQQYSSPAASYYPNGGSGGAQKQQQMPQHPVTKPAAGPWEKKETAGLHPAIRQEYGGSGMFHTNYQPVQNPAPPPRKESPILPPGYSKPPSQHQQQVTGLGQQWHGQYPQQQMNRTPTPQQQAMPVHTSPAAQYYSRPPSRHQSSPPVQPAPAPNQYSTPAAMHTPTASSSPSAQNFSQNYTAPVRSYYSDTYHATGAPLGKSFAAAASIGVPAAQKEAGQKPMFAHQQAFAGSVTGGLNVVKEGGEIAGMVTNGNEVVEGKDSGVSGDVPDVETDSTGMMETLMRNLQRVARQS